MKKLFRKIRARSGLSMMEMLAAVVALVLLCLALNSGMNIAVHAYRTMTAEAETELLLSTAADALTDELRYASRITITGATDSGPLGQYTSAHFGQSASIDINADGQLVVKNATDLNGHPLLASGAYGKDSVYKLSFWDTDGNPGRITYNKTTKTFTFTLRAEQKNLTYVEQKFTVRCLNGGVT